MNTTFQTRPFTLLEVIIVIALLGVIATFGTGAASDLLKQHSFQKETEQLKLLLQKLQMEALALESDMELQIEKKDHWKAVFKSSEKIVRSETVDLKHIQTVFLNNKAVDRLTITIFSTGRILPENLIEFRGDKSSLWVDLREPIQIQFTSAKPGDLAPKKIPPKPKESHGLQKLRIPI